jgi:hypothetical protein
MSDLLHIHAQFVICRVHMTHRFSMSVTLAIPISDVYIDD